MKQVFLALGGNLGDPRRAFCQALQAVELLPQTKLLSVSSLYRTKPVSDIPQGDFLNAACLLETGLSADTLFSFLEEIERGLGKVPKPKNAPRPIDIDLIFYGEEKLDTGRLTVPHPRWKERLFVRIPLMDLGISFAPLEREGIYLLERNWYSPVQLLGAL